MENKEKTLTKETELMQSLREFIPRIVGVRLEAMKASRWLAKQNIELELASENMEEAIDALSRAETAMGNAHQNLLVAQATLNMENNADYES